MAAEDRIIVNTGRIGDKAADLEHSLADLSRCVAGLLRITERSASFWSGEAGEAFRHESKSTLLTAEKILQELKKYPKRLEEAAGIFSRTDEDTENRAAELPTDLFG